MVKKGRQRAEKEAKQHEAAQQKKQDRAMKKEYRKKEERKRGRQSQQEDAQFDSQLEEIGLRIIGIQGDGNCMFRSIADQVEGDPNRHWHYRNVIMSFIGGHREDFEPFMEDDEKFDAYLSRLNKDGEWGGHQELYAASRLLEVSFVIHQFNAAVFHIESGIPNSRTLHLSYHGEMHYNSVRNIDDPVLPKTPPEPITLALYQATGGGGKDDGFSEAERLVSMSLPQVSLSDIKATLEDVDGNAEHAIELLVSGYVPPPSIETQEENNKRGNEYELFENEEFLRALDDIDKESREEGNTTEVNPKRGSNKGNDNSSSFKKQASGSSSVMKKEKEKGDKPMRQGLCHCGSMKKYKKCCMKLDLRKEAEAKKTQEKSSSHASIGLGAISI